MDGASTHAIYIKANTEAAINHDNNLIFKSVTNGGFCPGYGASLNQLIASRLQTDPTTSLSDPRGFFVLPGYSLFHLTVKVESLQQPY